MFGESEIAPSSVVIHNTDYILKEARRFDPMKVSTDLKKLKISAFQIQFKIQTFTIKKKKKKEKILNQTVV